MTACVHCGTVLTEVRQARRERFCCRGCESVHTLLQARGWDATVRSLGRPQPAFGVQDRFEDLDREPLLSQASRQVEPGHSGVREMRFYLEGAHCAACVWLTDRVSEWVEGTESVRLNLETGIAVARVLPGGSFAKVARELAALGYRPQVIFEVTGTGSAESLQRQAERRERVRLAVLGAIVGNLMLFSVPLYAGLTGELAHYFVRISGVIFLPALVWGGGPFFQAAWGALRKRQVGIDLPIAFGTLLASGVSYARLVQGSDQVYFDSIAGFLFLILASRSLLNRIQREALRKSRAASLLLPDTARLEGTEERVRTESLKVGDRVRVLPGESVPVDGTLCSDSGRVSLAWLTGESRAVIRSRGESILAGSIAEGEPFVLVVEQCGTQTRLGKLLSEVRLQELERPAVLGTLERVGKGFAALGLTGALVALGSGFFRGWDPALQSAVSVALVACPCAFGLTAPLIFSRVTAFLASRRIVVRRPSALEKLASLKQVFFDKTGTLTRGELFVLEAEVLPGFSLEALLPVVLRLELESVHPVARALVRFCEERGVRPWEGKFERFEERRAHGVAATLDGVRWSLERPVALHRDGECVLRFRLGDSVRPEAVQELRALTAQGFTLGILSGDSEGPVQAVAQELGVPVSQCRAGLAPEDKVAVLAGTPGALFVGDGANDALALSKASVGIAFHTGIEASLRASDFAVLDSRISGVREILRAGIVARQALRTVLAVSLLYNVLALGAALAGKVSPLLAAILMPLSSALTLATALWQTRASRMTGGSS